MSTGIQWTDETWNPVTGCSKVSQGCKNCYAERLWKRLSSPNMPYAGRAFTDVQCHPYRLNQPLRWKKPRRIFVNSMSDLFHEDVSFEFIIEVFAIMALSQQHTFQILTKRPKRMLDFLTSKNFAVERTIKGKAWQILGSHRNRKHSSAGMKAPWPFPNVWLGVSVEDQTTADERIPLLLDTPAAVRWISAEPLLGPVDLEHIQWPQKHKVDVLRCGAWDIPNYLPGFVNHSDMNGINWVVVGGESGPKARPMVLGLAKDIVRQCRAAGTPVFVKQLGANPTNREGKSCPHITHKKGADMSEWPDELQVREYPA